MRFADQLVKVVRLGDGEPAHGEVVEDEDVGADEFADASLPGAVRVAVAALNE